MVRWRSCDEPDGLMSRWPKRSTMEHCSTCSFAWRMPSTSILRPVLTPMAVQRCSTEHVTSDIHLWRATTPAEGRVHGSPGGAPQLTTARSDGRTSSHWGKSSTRRCLPVPDRCTPYWRVARVSACANARTAAPAPRGGSQSRCPEPRSGRSEGSTRSAAGRAGRPPGTRRHSSDASTREPIQAQAALCDDDDDLCSSSTPGRERHHETCPAILWELSRDATAVQLHDLPADVQPQPHPGRVRAGSLSLVEALEELSPVLGWDADPAIPNRQSGRAGIRAAHLHVNRPTLWACMSTTLSACPRRGPSTSPASSARSMRYANTPRLLFGVLSSWAKT